MFKRLYINNYALIDSAEIELEPGLSIITGEKGAGKTILLGALSLLLGARADVRRLAVTGRKIVVEGAFDTGGYDLRPLFDSHDLVWSDDELLLRREISPTGRSRAFVNDSPVTTAILGDIASRLVDIHSQHNNLLISDTRFQLGVLDSIAGNTVLRERYTATYREYVKLRSRVAEMKTRLAASRENEEFIRFRLDHLRKLKPKAGEQSELERMQEILGDSAAISDSLGGAAGLLSESDTSALSRLREARKLLQDVNLGLFASDGEMPDDIMGRLETVAIELKDIAETLSGWTEKVSANPALLDKVEKRLSALYETQRRFKVAGERELIELYADLERQLGAITGDDGELPELEEELRQMAVRLRQQAAELTESRREAAEVFSGLMVRAALPLGMANLKFAVAITPCKYTVEGCDLPVFKCAFNKNQEMQPVSSIASGGEISRLMLCLKSIVASRMQLPTLVFDEVDTGVSGDVAARIGAMMKEIAASRQVIAITHLPQVAVRGDVHFKVYKEDSADATHTRIMRLGEEERVMETARMLAGAVVDDAAIMNARSLLKL